jgi:hypothetical protein
LSVVCVVCCQVEVSATGLSLVQTRLADCGASLCVIKKPCERGGHSPRWAAEPQKIIIIIIINFITKIFSSPEGPVWLSVPNSLLSNS